MKFHDKYHVTIHQTFEMDWKTRLKPLIGTAICAISALTFCITNVMVKHLSHVDPFLIAAIRFWIIGLLSTPVSGMFRCSNFRKKISTSTNLHGT